MYFLKIIRFYNLLIIWVTQMIVRLFLVGPVENWKEVLVEKEMFLISVSTMLLAAAGYIINDYYDVKIDAINRPDRVVIDRSMKRRTAIILHFLLNSIGIGLGFLITWKLSVIYVGIATLLWLYSNVLKRHPFVGNFTIAFLSGATIWLLAIFYKQNEFLIYCFGLFAFIVSLKREIIKDIQDMKGDSSFGCKTLPIVWGVRRTKILLYIISISFLSSVAFLMAEENAKMFIFQLAVTFPLVVLFIVMLVRADTTKSFRMLSHLCKLILLSGVFSITLYT